MNQKQVRGDPPREAKRKRESNPGGYEADGWSEQEDYCPNHRRILAERSNNFTSATNNCKLQDHERFFRIQLLHSSN